MAQNSSLAQNYPKTFVPAAVHLGCYQFISAWKLFVQLADLFAAVLASVLERAVHSAYCS